MNTEIPINQKPIYSKHKKKKAWVKWVLLSIALIFLSLVLILPLTAIFVRAFAGGWSVYIQSITDPAALSAIQLTLLTVAIVVPLNTIFGVTAAWYYQSFSLKEEAF